jgi:hypothetical protein
MIKLNQWPRNLPQDFDRSHPQQAVCQNETATTEPTTEVSPSQRRQRPFNLTVASNTPRRRDSFNPLLPISRYRLQIRGLHQGEVTPRDPDNIEFRDKLTPCYRYW